MRLLLAVRYKGRIQLDNLRSLAANSLLIDTENMVLFQQAQPCTHDFWSRQETPLPTIQRADRLAIRNLPASNTLKERMGRLNIFAQRTGIDTPGMGRQKVTPGGCLLGACE